MSTASTSPMNVSEPKKIPAELAAWQELWEHACALADPLANQTVGRKLGDDPWQTLRPALEKAFECAFTSLLEIGTNVCLDLKTSEAAALHTQDGETSSGAASTHSKAVRSAIVGRLRQVDQQAVLLVRQATQLWMEPSVLRALAEPERWQQLPGDRLAFEMINTALVGRRKIQASSRRSDTQRQAQEARIDNTLDVLTVSLAAEGFWKAWETQSEELTLQASARAYAQRNFPSDMATLGLDLLSLSVKNETIPAKAGLLLLSLSNRLLFDSEMGGYTGWGEVGTAAVRAIKDRKMSPPPAAPSALIWSAFPMQWWTNLGARLQLDSKWGQWIATQALNSEKMWDSRRRDGNLSSQGSTSIGTEHPSREDDEKAARQPLAALCAHAWMGLRQGDLRELESQRAGILERGLHFAQEHDDFMDIEQQVLQQARRKNGAWAEKAWARSGTSRADSEAFGDWISTHSKEVLVALHTLAGPLRAAHERDTLDSTLASAAVAKAQGTGAPDRETVPSATTNPTRKRRL